jgi:hypothetical protein
MPNRREIPVNCRNLEQWLCPSGRAQDGIPDSTGFRCGKPISNSVDKKPSSPVNSVFLAAMLRIS